MWWNTGSACILVGIEPIVHDVTWGHPGKRGQERTTVIESAGCNRGCAFHVQTNDPLQLYYQYQNTPMTGRYFPHFHMPLSLEIHRPELNLSDLTSLLIWPDISFSKSLNCNHNLSPLIYTSSLSRTVRLSSSIHRPSRSFVLSLKPFLIWCCPWSTSRQS
jgi:hypothetical protein